MPSIRSAAKICPILSLVTLVIGIFSCRQKTPSPGVPHAGPALNFVAKGQRRAQLFVGMIRLLPGAKPVTIQDPHYEKSKRYFAVPWATVLRHGFRMSERALSKQHFVLRATDGYIVSSSGRDLLRPGALLAIEDLDVPAWEEMPHKHIRPGPFYLIWAHREQGSTKEFPWPWQLESIELSEEGKAFAKTDPRTAGASKTVVKGHELFVRECIQCHSINRQGGTLGPELNLPMSIVEYRDIDQLKRFIRNPQLFRYSKMPAHLHLGDDALDQLIAYFHAMKELKRDGNRQR